VEGGTALITNLWVCLLCLCRRAHTVLALLLITVVLVYVAVLEDTPNDTTYNTKRGLIAMVIVFILIGIIHMPDGPFVRPHPALWRLVLCVMIVYVLLLIFVLFQVPCQL